jgi:hypothetical protein
MERTKNETTEAEAVNDNKQRSIHCLMSDGPNYPIYVALSKAPAT